MEFWNWYHQLMSRSFFSNNNSSLRSISSIMLGLLLHDCIGLKIIKDKMGIVFSAEVYIQEDCHHRIFHYF